MSQNRHNRELTGVSKRLFSVDDANAMLPLVRAIAVDLVELSRAVIDRRQRMTLLTGGRDIDGEDPYSQELAQVQREIEQDVGVLQGYVEELRQLGVEPRDASEGIIDFPALLDGRDVHLCWKYDEAEVCHWHEVGAGFAGRQPLFAGIAADADEEGVGRY